MRERYIHWLYKGEGFLKTEDEESLHSQEYGTSVLSGALEVHSFQIHEVNFWKLRESRNVLKMVLRWKFTHFHVLSPYKFWYRFQRFISAPISWFLMV